MVEVMAAEAAPLVGVVEETAGGAETTVDVAELELLEQPETPNSTNASETTIPTTILRRIHPPFHPWIEAYGDAG